MIQAAKQIHQHLEKAKKIAIIPHQNPDGDALGAASAFCHYLRNLGKSAHIFCVTPANDKLSFIPKHSELSTNPAIFLDPELDTVVVLDSGDLRYAGVSGYLQNHAATIINIDHHNTNEHYGRYNLVLPTTSSTCEVLYHYFYHNHIAIDNAMATALLAGLTTDTGNFQNSATTASALKVGGQLLRSGGNLKSVYDGTVRNKSVDTLKLWGKVLSRLEKNEDKGITYTFVTQEDLAECQVPDNESEGIANFMNNLEDTKISLILKETVDGKVKGSFRTTKDDVDVSAMAKKLGGGGHKKAAGFTTDGPIANVLKKILTENI